MYSRFYMDVELDDKRKIGNIKTAYRIDIPTPTDLVSAFYKYSNDFFTSAHKIAAFLLEEENTDISQLDTYFFALAFLYRHSIELILKAIAFRAIRDSQDRVRFVKDTYHDLRKILDETIKIDRGTRSQQELEWLKAYLADASKIDRESDSFRYPFHIIKEPEWLGSGRRYSIKRVFEKQTHINLVSFANKFEAAYEILYLWYKQSTDSSEEWKRLSPVFIEEGGNYYGQSVVGYGYRHDDFGPYVDAYTEAAGYLRSLIIEKYDKSDLQGAFSLFFPMCYLYRKSVELVLKDAWFVESREDFPKRCEILNRKKHKILGLWKSLRNWIENYFDSDDDKVFFERVESCCDILNNYDVDASTFRYPCNKEMDYYFPNGNCLDVLNVAEFMESLIQAIDGICMELSARNEYIDEMEAEYRENMRSYESSY